MKLPAIKFAKSESLVLRCCRADMTSHGGFTWKKKGIVTAPDWDEDPHCGNGLQGWLAGEGRYRTWDALPGDLWIVLAVETKTIVDMGGKVKFPKARVLYVGARETAVALITAHCPGSAAIFGTATAGNYGTAAFGAIRRMAHRQESGSESSGSTAPEPRSFSPGRKPKCFLNTFGEHPRPPAFSFSKAVCTSTTSKANAPRATRAAPRA